jgi:hypothetical protein
MSLKTWKRRLIAFEQQLPFPEPGTEYWKVFFARAGVLEKLAEREPDFASTYAEYQRFQPPLNPEQLAQHYYLGEMLLRKLDDTPPCSVAEFSELVAWLEANEDVFPASEIADLRWRVKQGPRTTGSGAVAEKLRAWRMSVRDDASILAQ